MADGDDDGLLLNWATTESPASAKQTRFNPKSKSVKKQARREAAAKGTNWWTQLKRGGKHSGRDQAPRTVVQNSSLKGYSLGSVKAPKSPACSTSSDHAARPATGQSAAAATAATGCAGGGAEQRSTGAAAKPAVSRSPKANAAAATAPVADAKAGGDDMADIMAAVKLVQQRDAAAEADLPGHEKDVAEEGRGVVVFSTDTRPTKRRKSSKPRAPAPEPEAKPVKQSRHNVARRAGETAAAEMSVPQDRRTDVFGTVDGSTFAGLGLAESLSDHLEAINFTVPTRIQQEVIPRMLSGHDVLASAPTGSGKTLAYIAPIVHQIQGLTPRVTRKSGTHAVVMAPTRELCIQIYDVLALVLRRYHWLVAGTIYGGENRDKEKARLRKGINIVVATPGRLLDHLQNTKSFNVTKMHWLVLDEADRLLDLGFEQKIADIVHHLDERADLPRQTALFSATLHSKLGRLATVSLMDPLAVGFNVSQHGSELVVMGEAAGEGEEGADDAAPRQFELPSQLQQHFLEVPCKQRLAALAALLHGKAREQRDGGSGEGSGKLVVFFSTCAGVDFHHALLSSAVKTVGGRLPGHVFRLHGNLPQGDRTETFLEFTRSKSGVLLCTDVAARGLDFPAVSTIVQYDPPGEPSEYVHRVGRTARMGQAGEAILFLLPSEHQYLQMLNAHNVHLHPLQLQPVLSHFPEPEAAMASLMDAIDSDAELKGMATLAFRAFVRAYAAHPASVKDIFHIKKLHLGHVADSHALRDSPAVFGQHSKPDKKKDKFGGKAGSKGRPKPGLKRKTR